MLLMTMGSLTSLAQYPTTKKIKGEQVVIITTKQAESIDNKFKVLKDSATELNNQLNGCITSLNFTQNKVEVLNDSIDKLEKQVLRLKYTVTKMKSKYRQEQKRIEKLEFNDRKTKLQLKVGLIFIATTWIVGVITNR